MNNALIDIKQRSSPSTQNLKEESEQKIMYRIAASDGYRLRWKELLEKTKLSKRTLSRRLKQLVKEKKLTRTVDPESNEYPPPVFYELTIKRDARNLIEWEIGEQAFNEYKRNYDRLIVNFNNPEFVAQTFFESLGADVLFTLYQTCKASTSMNAGNKKVTIVPKFLIKYHLMIYEQILTGLARFAVINPRITEILEEAWKEHLADMENLRAELRNEFLSTFNDDVKSIAEAFYDYYLRNEYPKIGEKKVAQSMQEFLGKSDLKTLLESHRKHKIPMGKFKRFRNEALKNVRSFTGMVSFAE